MKKLILLCAILMAFGTHQYLSAQLPQRVVVIEEYTSATCVPCLIADSMLKPIVKISNGVIAVRYHQPIPFKGDPFYVANVPENKGRNDYYAVGSAMPAARPRRGAVHGFLRQLLDGQGQGRLRDEYRLGGGGDRAGFGNGDEMADLAQGHHAAVARDEEWVFFIMVCRK